MKNLKDVESFLYIHIPAEKVRFPGKKGLLRIKKFLKVLGNPQNHLKVVHVAGTSGKGSTAYFISLFLRSQGFKVGLKLSPHIFDFRERFQIDNQLLEEKIIVSYFNDLAPLIKKFNLENENPLTYFEILVSAGFFIFHKEGVDYAVVETGLGGLWDGTNCISKSKFVILTKIGIDHTKILGDTINKIAYQKAGIITNKSSVISIKQMPVAARIIKSVANKNNASLVCIEKKLNYHFERQAGDSLFFNFKLDDFKLENITLRTQALYQIENCSLALTALCKISKKDKFVLNEGNIFNALDEAHFAGRMDIISYKNKTLLLDGAHNPQKMAALVKSISLAYPNCKLEFIVSFKRDKNYKRMLDYIIPLAGKIYLTDFCCHQDSHIFAINPEDAAKYLLKQKFTNFKIVFNPREALEGIFSASSKAVVITGSFYLLSKVYSFICGDEK